MNPQEQREKFMRFLATLPAEALDQFSQKQIDIFLLVHDIAAGHELVLYEMGNICEGVRRVLAGEDSPANLVAFISEDKNIEEDNRGKVPEIAQEIQRQIFDAVLPILKQAGFPIKEGRVTYQSANNTNLRIDMNKTTSAISESSLIKGVTPSSAWRVVPGAVFGKGEQSPKAAPFSSARGGSSFGGKGDTASPSQLQVPNSKFQSPLDERHLRVLLRIAAGTIYTEQKLREAFEDLPQGLRQAITSVDTANAVQDIAKKYLLHVDQMGSLASETGLTLLGLTHPKNFVTNIAKRLRIPPERALEIGKEISAQILSKVRDSLRHLHEKQPTSIEQPPKAAPFGNGDKTTPQSLLSSEVGSVLWRRKGGDEVMSKKKFGVLAAQKEPVSDLTLKAISYKPKSGLATPYSPEAKWNLGEDSGLKIQDSSPEQLTREEVLRGIENPRTVPQLKTSNLQLETNVGPTGWRQPVNHEPRNMEHGAERKEQETKKVEPSTKTTAPSPLFHEEEREDLVEQKLSGPVSAPPTEHRYTTDPYREPFE